MDCAINQRAARMLIVRNFALLLLWPVMSFGQACGPIIDVHMHAPSFYMQDWHANSKTDFPKRICNALRPGGLIIIERFGPPRLRAGHLVSGFAGMKILRNETVTTEPEWGKGQQRTIVRSWPKRRG